MDADTFVNNLSFKNPDELKSHMGFFMSGLLNENDIWV